MTDSSLLTRAMLVSLRLTAWSARKYDKRITLETNEAHGAAADAGRYNKALMPSDAPTYKALNSHVSELRLIHYAQTLPWSDEGWRLLPIANYQAYTDKLRAGQHTFNSLLSEFVNDYPALRNEARIRLNGMYSDLDYPADVRAKYSFAIEFAPVPSGGDFRVELGAAEIAVIAARTEERVTAALADAQADAVNRLYECLSKMTERLSQPDAIFRDSLIENARELCGVLTRLNLADDQRLESFRRQTELLAMAEPETLRKNPDVRIDTAMQAQSILEAMQATYGPGVAL